MKKNEKTNVSKEKIKKMSKSMLTILTAGMVVLFASACGNKSLPSAVEDTIKATSESEITETQESASNEETTLQEESSEIDDNSSSLSDESVSPDFKETMDSYEDFMDEYIEFMKKYSESDNVQSMLIEYSDFVTKYADYVSKIEAIDEDELSAADLAYYIEVTARVTEKLSKIS